MWLLQTKALLIDTYRELNAKKLFWAVLAISGVIIVAIAALNITPTGLSVFGFQLESAIFNDKTIPKGTFHKMLFAYLGVNLWLGWGATILAIISTAGMIPDFVSGGAIENTLSKPIGRVRLFLTKYLSGLLFVFLQVAVFSLASFLVIGLRGKSWEPGVFVAVPLVTIFYSYLFCVCALAGLVTRSTIAALLVTLLFWMFLFALNTADKSVGMYKIHAELNVKSHERRIALLEEREAEAKDAIEAYRQAMLAQNLWSEPPAAIGQADGKDESGVATAADEPTIWLPAPPEGDEALAELHRTAELRHRRFVTARDFVDKDVRPNLPSYQKQQRVLTKVHRWLLVAKTMLPKTNETVSLLQRWVLRAASIEPPRDANNSPELDEGTQALFAGSNARPSPLVVGMDSPEMARAMREMETSRSPWWIIGTSLIFESVVVGIACLIFARRDF
jgi:ABC-type transport system involved in multi-copper enzyme maturation permease subunit